MLPCTPFLKHITDYLQFNTSYSHISHKTSWVYEKGGFMMKPTLLKKTAYAG